MAGFLPASEGDLLRSRPGSNRPGVFPPGALLAEEKIVYETRPRLMGLHPALVLAPLPFAFLFGAAIVVGVAQGVGGTGFAIAGVIVVLLILSPALYGVYDWRRTAYVITDQRVAVRSGDSYETATFEMVRNVSLAPDSSKVVFELLPPPDAPPRAGFRLSRKSRLVWVGLEGAPAVASFGQSAIEYLPTPKSAAAPSAESRRVVDVQHGRVCVLRRVGRPLLGERVGPAVPEMLGVPHGRAERTLGPADRWGRPRSRFARLGGGDRQRTLY